MMQWSISALARRFHAKLSSQEDRVLTHLCTLEEGREGGVSFFYNPKYASLFYQTQASAVLVPEDFIPTRSVPPTLLAVRHPYQCFCTLIREWYHAHHPAKVGIEFPSYIGENVSVGKDVYRGAFSYIGNHVVIGNHVQIYPQVYIGDYATIEAGTILYSGAKIGAYTVIGKHCVVHAGAVIGSAGFGFTTDARGAYQRIPSIGHVVLADEVEIGAATVIDAATVGKTFIAQGTKIDNLVQIAHNVTIGKHSGIAAQVGIAGSSHIGAYARLGGQTGIAGHLHLGDHITALGRAGITRSFPKGHITLSGTPAFEHKKFLTAYTHFKNLGQKQKENRDDTSTP